MTELETKIAVLEAELGHDRKAIKDLSDLLTRHVASNEASHLSIKKSVDAISDDFMKAKVGIFAIIAFLGAVGTLTLTLLDRWMSWVKH